MSETDETNPSSGFSSVSHSRFQFLRPHAKGGMGIVSIHLDSELNREVAFKQIQPQNADVESSRSDFVLEAEVTGQLEHPGIVPVYSLGKDSTGRPFYAMRFVRGTNLAEDIARFHAKDAKRTPAERSLEQRELLGRFLDVCDVIAYAHSRGVVHRDLKPANIMLGRYGETLVVDWGVAKLTGTVPAGAEQEPVRPSTTGTDTTKTMLGSLKGTASYMSPEQAEGRVDRISAATDIYGLGATLYHLLCSRAPVEGQDTGEIIRKVARGEIPSLRTVDSAISRSVEAICMKAMANKPEDRYQSARDLGDDLKRWLADEAVSCCKDPVVKRLARVIRHHPQKTNAIIIGLAAVVAAGSAVFTYERAQREELRKRGERLLTHGEELLTRGQNDGALEQLTEARAALQHRPDLFELRGRVERALTKVQARSMLATFLANVAEANEQILGSLWAMMPHEDPDGRRRIKPRGDGPTTLETGIAKAKEAIAVYGLPGDSGSVREPRDLEPDSAARLRERAGETLFLLALAEERVGQGRAGDEQRAQQELACRLLDVAESLGNQTWSLYQHRAKFRKALGRKDDADADRRRAEQTAPATFLDHHFKAIELDRERKRLAEAATEYRIALAARADDYWTLYRLAKTMERLGQLPQAESLFRNIVTLRPGDPTTHNTLGTLLSDQEKNEEAIAEFEAALRADPDYIMAYGNMMKVQGNQKNVDAAEATFRRLMSHSPDAREQARGWDFLGIAYERAGQDKEAIKKYDEAIRLDPGESGTLRNRSLCRSRLGRHSEAVEDADRAIKVRPDSGELYYVKGLAYSTWARDRAASRDQREVVARLENAIAAYGEAIKHGHGPARYNRGVMLRQLGRFEEALSDQDELVKSNPNSAYALYERAMNNLHLKNFRVAIDDLDRVLILDTPQAKDLRVDAYHTRGQAWGDLGTDDDLKRSEADMNRAIALEPKNPNFYRSRGLTRMKRAKATDPAKPETDEQAGICRDGIADYRKYLELRPNAPDASSILNDLNAAYLKLGNSDESIALLDQAIGLKQNPSLMGTAEMFACCGERYPRPSPILMPRSDLSQRTRAPGHCAGSAGYARGDSTKPQPTWTGRSNSSLATLKLFASELWRTWAAGGPMRPATTLSTSFANGRTTCAASSVAGCSTSWLGSIPNP